jgi:hydrogenase assembly chaperone HypC/HupF
MNTKLIDLASQTGDHCELDADGHCITCMDEAVPARVVEVDATQMLAQVEIGGASAEVDISLVDDVEAGEWLLVHGGVALERVALSAWSGAGSGKEKNA